MKRGVALGLLLAWGLRLWAEPRWRAFWTYDGSVRERPPLIYWEKGATRGGS